MCFDLRVLLLLLLFSHGDLCLQWLCGSNYFSNLNIQFEISPKSMIEPMIPVCIPFSALVFLFNPQPTDPQGPHQ